MAKGTRARMAGSIGHSPMMTIDRIAP
jgi:hypothetical protein